LEEVDGCLDRHAKLKSVAQHADQFTIRAVERGYQASPRHESLKRHGIEAGRRDGKFLLEKIVQAAIVSGPEAEQALHQYFINEQVRLSKLPGGVVVEFLRGLQEQLREFPSLVELLAGLAQTSAGYTASARLDAHCDQLATEISNQAIMSSANYRAAIGENGLEACIRDNKIMLRGLASCLLETPNDVAPFKEWWKRRIGKHLNAKPEGFHPDNPWGVINVRGLVESMHPYFDNQEIDFVEDYLTRVTSTSGQNDSTSKRSRSMQTPTAVMSSGSDSMTFSDVVV